MTDPENRRGGPFGNEHSALDWQCPLCGDTVPSSRRPYHLEDHD